MDYANQSIESLSDRLSKLDQYSQEVNPESLGFLTGLQRPAGANPLPIEAQKLAVGTNAMEQWNKGWAMLSDLLTKKQSSEQFDKEFGLKEKTLAQDRELKMLELQGKYNPSSVVLKGNDKTAMRFTREIYSAAKLLESTYDPSLSGAGDYLLGTFKKSLNAPGGAEAADYRKTIAQVNSAIRNKLSGTAVSEQEAKVLNEFLIKSTDSDTTVKSKISGLIDYSKRSAQAVLDTNNYDVDAGEYLSISGSNQSGSKVTMTAPDGQQYQVDESEVEEARQNGWK